MPAANADRGRERRAPADRRGGCEQRHRQAPAEEVDVELMRVERGPGDAPPERDVFAEGGVRPDAEREPLAARPDVGVREDERSAGGAAL